jgi:hypothetical protein
MSDQDRIDSLHERIAAISVLPEKARGLSPDNIRGLIKFANAIDVSFNEFLEFTSEASIAKQDAIDWLYFILNESIAREEEMAITIEANLEMNSFINWIEICASTIPSMKNISGTSYSLLFMDLFTKTLAEIRESHDA